MSSDEILGGLGLVLVLAVSSQLAARRLRVPAIVVLLPVGFAAGAATTYVQPDHLLGSLYQPFVTLAVGVILFEAGLRLSARDIVPGVGSVVLRLVTVGATVTWFGITAATYLLFPAIDGSLAFLIGAILVVSGPTVVLPLLAHIRPAGDVRSLLKWEGVLVDPIGALLGVLVLRGVKSSAHHNAVWVPGELFLSIAIGAAVGAVAAVMLLALLREVHRNAPRHAVAATMMMVVAAVVVADLIRDDTGLVAATLMGAALGNQRRIDIALTREFQETLVQLLIGVLFILIAASVSPHDVRAVLPEALVLVAVIALVVRPAAVAVSTIRSPFSRRERAFAAWMAPRGIVAGATASAFALQLEGEPVQGSGHLLPIVFVVILGTVALYGLSGPAAARALGLVRDRSRLVLVVGGHAGARAIAAALSAAGVAVRMWAGRGDDQGAARAAGLSADHGRLMVDSVSREAELEEVTDALVLTSSDDFNTVAASVLRTELGHGHVYRLAPDPLGSDMLPPSDEVGILGSAALTHAELSRRFRAGARLVETGGRDLGGVPLFAVGDDGRFSVAADGRPPRSRPGDVMIVLAAGGGDPAADGPAQAFSSTA